MSFSSVLLRQNGRISLLSRRSIWSTQLFKANKNKEEDDVRTGTRDMTYTLCKTINGVPPQRTFNVVSQIHRYEEYIPYCIESIVNERDIKTTWPCMASLRIGFRQYDETFICKVMCAEKYPDHYMIIADSISNHLFNGFKCQWDITSHPHRPGSTEIKLSLKFQFKSALYNGVASLFARGLTSLALNSFHKRIIQCERGEVKL